MWKLWKLLYGLCKAGDNKYKTFKRHDVKELDLPSVTTDPSLYMTDSNSSTKTSPTPTGDLIFSANNIF